MQVINIKDEDIINYKEISMFIGMPYCSGKCWRELNLPCTICQNSSLTNAPIYSFTVKEIIKRYLGNPLTTAIVFGGMEPLDSFDDILEFLKEFRNKCARTDTVVIYTGYKEEEIKDKLVQLSSWDNIILKVGRYVPNKPSRYDDILGVTLASDNQYAIKL